MTELIVACSVISIALLALLLPSIFVKGRRGNETSSMSKKVLATMVLAVPLVSAFAYTQMGASEDIQFYQRMQQYNTASPQEQLLQQTEFLYSLEQRANANPENGEYWYLLGMHRFGGGMYAQAAVAFEKSAEVFTEDATILAKWAESLFIANEFSLTPQVQSLIGRVLSINPNEPTVLGMSGIVAFQGGYYQEAIKFWQTALEQLPPNSPSAVMINDGLAQAHERLAAEQGSEGALVATQVGSTDLEGSTAVLVNLSLSANVDADPNDALFLFLRQPAMPMPLVVQRLNAGALPVTIRLEESQAMIPGTKLDQLPAVEVVARITKSGGVTAESGDYEEVYGPLQLEAGELVVDIVIESQIP